jgi:sarcosine oxidase subunit gamma
MPEAQTVSSGTAHSMAERPIRVLPSRLRLSLRIRSKDAEAVRWIGGLTLDGPINRFSAVGECLAARLGPDEWAIIAAPSEADSIASDIASALADRFHVVVDVSQRSVCFAVEGPIAANILNAGCPIDLDSRHFPAGSATRTMLGKCEIVLLRLSNDAFRVECWRSFGEYVQAFLLEAAALNPPADSR